MLRLRLRWPLKLYEEKKPLLSCPVSLGFLPEVRQAWQSKQAMEKATIR